MGGFFVQKYLEAHDAPSDGFRKLYFSECTPHAVLADAATRFSPTACGR
jgi:hypothetical protein